jgi:hypothetical protein
MGGGNKDDVGLQQSANSPDLALTPRSKYIIELEGGWAQNEAYKVKDEEGNVICQGERGAVLYKLLLPLGLIVLVALLSAGGLFESAVLGVVVSMIVFGAIVVIILKPRNLFVYRSGSENERILSIVKCKVYERIPGTYAIETAAGSLLGYLRYNWVLSFFRPKMKCYGADGSLLCTIAEPFSARFVGRWILFAVGLLIRFILDIGGRGTTYRPVDNFNVLDPIDSHVIGKFSRDTIELVPEAHIDGRICLAMGLMTCSALKWL